jgi:hypothetical protein
VEKVISQKCSNLTKMQCLRLWWLKTFWNVAHHN